MVRCNVCHGPVAQLSRTATCVWLGCPACHRTWSVEVGSGGAELTDVPLDLDGPVSTPSSLVRGSLGSLGLVALALIVRVLLRPVLGSSSPFLLFTPAVAIAAFYGGVAPGVLATAASAALGSHFFLGALGEPGIERWDRIILFAIVGGVMTGSGTLLRRSRQQLAASLWREQRARAIAEAADRAKDDFLALITHELQTPVSVVLGWTTVILQHGLGDDACTRALTAIARNARIVSRLVDDVLDRSRIATGTLRLDRRRTSLPAIVRASVDQFRDNIESAGLDLDFSSPRDDSMVVADPMRLQQVFTNLLANAVKFTPRGGRISVSVSASPPHARVVVTDTGSGISPDVLPHVFSPFRQGHDTLKQSPRGLGLGLSIARYLVEQHGGTIAAASLGAGCGSSFTIDLPLAATSCQTDAAELPMTPNVPAEAAIP